jgi:phosphatidylglycerophosphatase A
MMNRIAWLIGTWFGCGHAPIAPGTVGSAGGLLAAVAAAKWLDWSRTELIWATVAIVIPAVWAADRVANSIGAKDPGRVVVDEVAGQWLTLWGATHFNFISLALGFLLFRLFDVWKPFPARQLEALPGGAGIVADDLAAGVWAALVLYAVGWFNLY